MSGTRAHGERSRFRLPLILLLIAALGTISAITPQRVPPVENPHAVLLTNPPAQRTALLTPIATDATDPDHRDDSEPTIAVNPLDPQQIAVLTFSGGWDPEETAPKAEHLAPIWKSKNGGQTWHKVHQIPCPELKHSGPADQKVAYDAKGRLLVVAMRQGKPPRCFFFRQTGDDGAAPLRPGVAFGNDQPLLDLDNFKNSERTGLAYCAFTEYVDKKQDRAGVAVSIDRGETAKIPELNDGKGFSHGTTRIAVGSNGTVHLLYKTREGGREKGFEKARFWVRSSSDGGRDWSDAVCVHEDAQIITFASTEAHPFGNPKKGKTAMARNSDAWIATHPTEGTVFVTFVRRDETGFGQIYLTQSRFDRGMRGWREPVRVTDGRNHAAYPALAVAETGAIGVLYVDYDDSQENTRFRHRLARSFDDGRTWTDQILQEFDPNRLENATNHFLWGEYQGLTVHDETFYGVFSGESIRRRVPELDPIFFTETAKKP